MDGAPGGSPEDNPFVQDQAIRQRLDDLLGRLKLFDDESAAKAP
ncbi:MAG TPA: hypothetical protein VMV10_04890 [Pirellulales bacterium]|nr:hypothetical protein [Pirellulales bacterium]